MDKWLGNLTAIGSDSTSIRYRKHDHQRFFPFAEMAKCKSPTCVGGACRKDDSKIVCGMEELQKQQTESTKKDKDTNNTTTPPPCVVYSIGGNNEWQFELDLLRHTPCEIHTFDCTGHKSRFKVPSSEHKDNAHNNRLHFHHVCLVAYPELAGEPRPSYMKGDYWTLLEMQQKLNHQRIDLLKVDIEGWEFSLFDSWQNCP
jgi:hypothetical protein